MKIKTKRVSYEQAMAIPPMPHRKPWRPSFLLSSLVRVLSEAELRAVHFTYTQSRMEEAGKGPKYGQASRRRAEEEAAARFAPGGGPPIIKAPRQGLEVIDGPSGPGRRRWTVDAGQDDDPPRLERRWDRALPRWM